MHQLALTDNIRILTARVTAQRFTLENERMHMSRLSEKLQKAGGVAKRLSDSIEARADALIARETALEKRTNEVFSPHESILSEAERGLQAVERELALMSNDPLERSGASLEPEVPLPPLPPAPPPDVVHVFEIELKQPEPQTTPQDPARAMAR